MSAVFCDQLICVRIPRPPTTTQYGLRRIDTGYIEWSEQADRETLVRKAGHLNYEIYQKKSYEVVSREVSMFIRTEFS